jgi:hypothetical protein
VADVVRQVSAADLTPQERSALAIGVDRLVPAGGVPACTMCAHLLTAHVVPSGRCTLCGCDGWSDPDRAAHRQEGAQARHRFVVDVLSCTRYPGCKDEYALQDAAAERLRSTGAPVEREVVLSATERPDLLVDGVCVEVKVAGSPSQVLFQLRRYAAHRQVESLVLLTRRAQHRRLPAEVGGKPLTVVHTGAVL